MMRRTVPTLAGFFRGKVVPGERLGDRKLTVWDTVGLINPFYHIERLNNIEEDICGTKQRKWINYFIVMGFPLYWVLFTYWEEDSRLAPKVDGKYPEPVWNDERAGSA